MARDELRAAELLAEHGIAQLSCFHCEQAVEKALMALRLHGERHAAPDDPLPHASSADHLDEAAHGKGAALEAVRNVHQLLDRITERVYGS